MNFIIKIYNIYKSKISPEYVQEFTKSDIPKYTTTFYSGGNIKDAEQFSLKFAHYWVYQLHKWKGMDFNRESGELQ